MCKILREILLSYVRKREIEMCFIQNLSHEMKHLTLKYRWNIGFCTLHESIWWSLRVISSFFALREISLFFTLRVISLFFAQREILRERQRAIFYLVQWMRETSFKKREKYRSKSAKKDRVWTKKVRLKWLHDAVGYVYSINVNIFNLARILRST